MAEVIQTCQTHAAGMPVRVDILTDDETLPEDSPGTYTPEQFAAFEAGAWRYAGIVVTPLIIGVDKGLGFDHSEVSEQLFGIEWGAFPTAGGVAHIGMDEVVNRLMPTLIAGVRRELRHLRDRLLSMDLSE